MRKIIFVIIMSLVCMNVCGIVNAADAAKEDATFAGNPHTAEFLDQKMIDSIESIRRIDDDGLLYFMDYTADYNSQLMEDERVKFWAAQSSCSVFTTENTDGKKLTCRNFDFEHYDKDGNPTGLNVVVATAPEGGYKSIGMADAYWLDVKNGTFVAGTLDDGETDISYSVLLPFLCMDGINEKGLTVSILKLDIKDGETCAAQNEEGKPSTSHIILLRNILDNCATVEDAAELAASYNMIAGGTDYHLFVSDATGKSVVLEWRYNKLYVTEVNAATNFYSSFDDGEDYYKEDVFTENFVKLVNTEKEYHYGYGHGFHRMTMIVSNLERYLDRESEEYRVVMREDQARDILRVAAQDIDTEGTNMTQYSAIYNSDDLTMKLWLMQNYDEEYDFEIK